MKAYRIGVHIIAADFMDDAKAFFLDEVGEPLPSLIEELDWLAEVPCEDGTTATIKSIVNRTLDERNAWLRMGIPCDLYCPFIVARLP
jgi:hypothetical protein